MLILFNFDRQIFTEHMIYEFEPLNKEEKDVLLKAPALIAVLIAGADDSIDQHELKRAVELVNIRTFSEKQDLHPYYQEVEKTIQQDIADIIAALADTATERNPIISDELAKVNKLLLRIKAKFARDLYASWISYAHLIAQSWGGVMGINSVGLHEKQWRDLPMINEPAAAE